MRQPWIDRPATDGTFILAPAFVVVAFALIFQETLIDLGERYPFYVWLFLIVFIDVAHVYATLFKTYFVASEFRARRALFIGLPVFCFLVGTLLFWLGSAIFWSVLAYVAVFHFIRQQYGFMRLYSRTESAQVRVKWFDNLVIYTATGFPMLYWFLSPARQFNWFVENEFVAVESPLAITVLTYVYYLVMASYVVRTAYVGLRFKWFNIPKNGIILGTAASWYLGIVWFDSDVIFTLLNVVSHGIPYIALVYLVRPDRNRTTTKQVLLQVTLYISLLLIIGFSEEYLWESLVWKEHFSGFSDASFGQFLLVPLLTVPQFTHYILDGFIWKSKKS